MVSMFRDFYKIVFLGYMIYNARCLLYVAIFLIGCRCKERLF